MKKEEREGVLQYLFERYISTDGLYRIDLNGLIKDLGENAVPKLKSLQEEGVIRHLETLKSGTTAMLTYKGALEANSGYFKEQGDRAISALMHEVEKCHMLLALGMNEDKIQLAFDIVEYLENEGLAYLDRTNKNYTLHLSPRGREYYFENQPFFF